MQHIYTVSFHKDSMIIMILFNSFSDFNSPFNLPFFSLIRLNILAIVSVHRKTTLATDICVVYTVFICVLCMIYKGCSHDL